MKSERYDHQAIEAKWQRVWEEKKVFQAPTIPDVEKKYVLDMFPFLSGAGLHVGHPEGYTASDITTRFLRMKGLSIVHPMGWDSFGLPTENAAIKKGVHPKELTNEYIATFKRQIKSIGFAYDWNREISTADPKYYKWTQWIFLQLFKKGLAYEKEAPIWWCPKDKTGLANEEVVNGKCERCGTTVERKNLRQWMLKITAYADRLLSGLDKLDWPEGIKTLQRNWIGRSEGAEVKFQITNSNFQTNSKSQGENHDVWVFTTRPDTLFGATYLVLSPEHELVENITTSEQKKAVQKYIKEVSSKSDLERTSLEKEKSGVFTGAYAINPVNNEKIPVWIADYVLLSYGTGAIMAVPAHDERDWEFSRKYNLPIVPVVRPTSGEPRAGEEFRKTISATVVRKSDGKILAVKWKQFSWISMPIGGIDDNESPAETAVREVLEETGYRVRAVELLGDSVESHFYAENKKVWRHRLDQPILLELIDETPVSVASEEAERQTPIWLKPEELRQQITHPENLVGLNRYEKNNYAFCGEGALINSGKFTNIGSVLARKQIVEFLEKQGSGKFTVNYKLRDWVFSRQRYWGEPIPLVHCPACLEKVESEAHVLNVWDQKTWHRLITGEKRIETRALNPDEPERYFGNIGDEAYLKFINKVTKDSAFFQVTKTWRFKNLEDLMKHPEVFYLMKRRERIPTLEEVKQGYSYQPDYVDRIQKNGLIGWEIERVIPGIVPVPEKDLPILLPDVENYQPMGTGESPLSAIKDWVETTCPKCGGPAKRETNTMPQWAGSCWYYLRYLDPHNDQALADPAKLKTWLPVDMYIGGAEHAVLHLLYSRFWHMVLYDAGVIPKENNYGQSLEEPFITLKNQGLILGEDGEKMSKSRGNVVNPDDIITKFGADSLRLYEMFMGPFEDVKPWQTNGIVGVYRFLEKVWQISGKVKAAPPTDEKISHRYIASITRGIEEFRFNTCVSDLMKWSNVFKGQEIVSQHDFEIFLKLLSPFAPHICEELWQQLGHPTLLSQEPWPDYDATMLQSETVTIAVQVNGKHRGNVMLPAGSNESVVREAAEMGENVKKYLSGKPKKVIYVKDRLLNYVV